MQPLLHVDELLDLALHELGHRHAGPGRDDLGDVVGGDLFAKQRAGPLEAGQRRLLLLEPGVQLGQGLVLELRRGFVVRLALGLLDPNLEPFELGLRRADRGDRGLLGLPALLQGARLLLDVGQLLLERGEPRLRCVVGLLPQRLPLDLELDPAPLGLVELDRHRVDLHAQPRRRLVHEVDGLVRQEALGDIAV